MRIALSCVNVVGAGRRHVQKAYMRYRHCYYISTPQTKQLVEGAVVPFVILLAKTFCCLKSKRVRVY